MGNLKFFEIFMIFTEDRYFLPSSSFYKHFAKYIQIQQGKSSSVFCIKHDLSRGAMQSPLKPRWQPVPRGSLHGNSECTPQAQAWLCVSGLLVCNLFAFKSYLQILYSNEFSPMNQWSNLYLPIW